MGIMSRRTLAILADAGRTIWRTLGLTWRRALLSAKQPGEYVQLLHYRVRLNDGPNYYMLYKDLFLRHAYRFEAARPDPVILDCGSNIGLSVLYFKHLYPAAKVVAFEPDPATYPYLEENVRTNGLADVQLVQAAVSGEAGTLRFYSDGKYAAHLAPEGSGPVPEGWRICEVPCVRLAPYLEQPVDLLKMNIEGAEWDVLSDCAEQLRNVREMMIEYHHMPGLPRRLHDITALLHRQGFEYAIYSFDDVTNPGSSPPFHLDDNTSYFLLIYAKRVD